MVHVFHHTIFSRTHQGVETSTITTINTVLLLPLVGEPLQRLLLYFFCFFFDSFLVVVQRYGGGVATNISPEREGMVKIRPAAPAGINVYHPRPYAVRTPHWKDFRSGTIPSYSPVGGEFEASPRQPGVFYAGLPPYPAASL